jgi:hypothetical protein
MKSETLKFKLGLYSQHWHKPPVARVLLNGKEYFNGQITASEDDPKIIEFTHELEHDKTYSLDIERSNKNHRQTVLKDGKIIKDQVLHIKSLEIDEIDVGTLVYEGVYKPQYPEPWASQQREAGNDLPESLKSVTAMGHNGTWSFEFTSPFYMWLLENLY